MMLIMAYPNQSNYRDRRSQSYEPRGRSNDRSFNRPALFDAVCAKCGADCQVPFRPNGRKEVYCSRCFEAGAGAGAGHSDRSSSSQSRPVSNLSNPTLEAISTKLDTIIKLLTPAEKKPKAPKVTASPAPLA